MSDQLKHECGIALIRLKHPLDYYEQKYGTPLYGFNKLFLLMEKQHNRGQDGAGIGCVKLNMPKGEAYMFRERALNENSLGKLFKRELKRYDKLVRQGLVIPEFTQTVKQHFQFGGEVLMGHLRYGTSGAYSESSCHPYFRRSNWASRNLMVLGNFNMTNARELNQKLIDRGQHPIFDTDTQTVLEEIGYHLDEQHQSIYREARSRGVPGPEIPKLISDRLDIVDILRESANIWDGGYVIAGMVGNGDSFVLRDPNGIRPCYWFEDDEVIAFASERVPLLTVFEKDVSEVSELAPGHVVSIKASGEMSVCPFTEPRRRASCSFERIYFSRGNDPDIYRERKALGGALASQLLEAIEFDLGHAVFSYIPNTAETAFYGLLDSLRVFRRNEVKAAILRAHEKNELTEDLLDELILNNWPRSDKIAHKDIKLRTFISQEKGRSRLVSHVYDITYGTVTPEDSLVVLDDSIVRGTTLRESIIKILARTRAKRIVVASTAPQIRYPDCYGIDMSELGKFIAFQAAIELLKDTGAQEVITETYRSCLAELKKPVEQQVNRVKDIYARFTDQQVADKIAELLRPPEIDWDGELKIVYQTIEDLHKCLPENSGDWYFTGNYPTPGGTMVANQAYVDYFEKRTGRSYDKAPSLAMANSGATIGSMEGIR